jgi:hypothetical protein
VSRPATKLFFPVTASSLVGGTDVSEEHTVSGNMSFRNVGTPRCHNPENNMNINPSENLLSLNDM